MSIPRIRTRRQHDRDENDDGYEIGYGKPPRHTRFQKGRSGNPKGRVKGNRNLKTDLAEEMAERIEVAEKGRRKKVSKQRLVLKAMATKAIKGDTRAAALIIRLIADLLDVSDQTGAANRLDAGDERLIRDFLDRNRVNTDAGDLNVDSGDGDKHG